ncbi:hypothetical protein BDZ89DRAFT_1072775 [Hymenopellis radicata]|nr:hypothetical protein BDZ89DRAFT_1072775 [Hymenopellis radicata]
MQNTISTFRSFRDHAPSEYPSSRREGEYERQTEIIYGHGGTGFTPSFGCSRDVNTGVFLMRLPGRSSDSRSWVFGLVDELEGSFGLAGFGGKL